MFAAFRASKNSLSCPSIRAFSTTRVAADIAKLTIVGRLVREPERRLTRNEKDYLAYTVVTRNSILNENGERQYTPTFHRVLCFNSNAIEGLTRLKKGSYVYVEAGYNIKEPEQGADPATPQGQRHIFLTHDSLKVLYGPKATESEGAETEETKSTETSQI